MKWVALVWALLAVGWALGWVTARWYQTRMRELGWDLYQCPHCEAISHDPFDVTHRYCGVCHRFEDGSRLG